MRNQYSNLNLNLNLSVENEDFRKPRQLSRE